MKYQALVQNNSTGSLADSQVARIEERPELDSKADGHDNASRAHSKAKREADEVDQTKDERTEEVLACTPKLYHTGKGHLYLSEIGEGEAAL